MVVLESLFAAGCLSKLLDFASDSIIGNAIWHATHKLLSHDVPSKSTSLPPDPAAPTNLTEHLWIRHFENGQWKFWNADSILLRQGASDRYRIANDSIVMSGAGTVKAIGRRNLTHLDTEDVFREPHNPPRDQGKVRGNSSWAYVHHGSQIWFDYAREAVEDYGKTLYEIIVDINRGEGDTLREHGCCWALSKAVRSAELGLKVTGGDCDGYFAKQKFRGQMAVAFKRNTDFGRVAVMVLTDLCFVQDGLNVKLVDMHFDEHGRRTRSEWILLSICRGVILYDAITKELTTEFVIYEQHRTENDKHYSVKAVSSGSTQDILVPHAGTALRAILFGRGLTINTDLGETICSTQPGTVSVGATRALCTFSGIVQIAKGGPVCEDTVLHSIAE